MNRFHLSGWFMLSAFSVFETEMANSHHSISFWIEFLLWVQVWNIVQFTPARNSEFVGQNLERLQFEWGFKL